MIKTILLSVRKAFALVATITGFLAFSAAPAAAAVLLVDGNGQLTGATGVDVGGTLFDVTFVDGTCAALFDGCDEASDFAFNDQATATLAAQALFDQVFIDGPAGNFETNLSSIFGCGSPIFCEALVPFLTRGSSFDAVAAFNSNFEIFNPIDLREFISAQNDLSQLDSNVFASFTEQGVSEVPLPAAAWMFLAGLGGLSAARRKKRAKNSKEL